MHGQERVRLCLEVVPVLLERYMYTYTYMYVDIHRCTRIWDMGAVLLNYM